MDQIGREDLVAWRAATPRNYLSASPDLERLLTHYLGPESAEPIVAGLEEFGHVVAEVIEPAVVVLEGCREYPRLRPYDAVGQLVEQIEFHPAQRDAALAAWGSGMLSARLDHAGAFDVAANFFLLSHVGEGGQACPIVCTIGLRRALEHHGDADTRGRYLPGIATRDANVALRGSQFLTEVQGGSDVGANVTRAEPDPAAPGAWRVTGEKWFCSVADADLFALTARVDPATPGTAGLGCFLVPRTLDGSTPNGFRLRRLKDKLGTRALASAEIDFDGALAWPIGDVAQGFKIAVTELLNTSRWLNAVGSTGIMSRAYIEAATFASHRRAFGSTIVDFAGVREQLAIMRCEAAAALSSTFALTDLVGKLDEGTATPDEVAVHRFLVNANKYVTSITATDVVHRAIEVLGGNGTIEDFSALPRLYRDAIVFESWEGSHNVLCNQVRRDCQRLGLLRSVAAWTKGLLGAAPDSLAPTAKQVGLDLDGLVATMTRCLVDSPGAEARFRHVLTDMMRVIQAACLLRDAALFGGRRDAVAALFVSRLDAGSDWTDFVDDALAQAGYP